MIQRLLNWWRGAEEKQFLVCRCQHCQQKIRFSPQKAGTHSLCPRCRRSIKLPLENEPVRRVGHAAVGHRILHKTEHN